MGGHIQDHICYVDDRLNFQVVVKSSSSSLEHFSNCSQEGNSLFCRKTSDPISVHCSSFGLCGLDKFEEEILSRNVHHTAAYEGPQQPPKYGQKMHERRTICPLRHIVSNKNVPRPAAGLGLGGRTEAATLHFFDCPFSCCTSLGALKRRPLRHAQKNRPQTTEAVVIWPLKLKGPVLMIDRIQDK